MAGGPDCFSQLSWCPVLMLLSLKTKEAPIAPKYSIVSCLETSAHWLGLVHPLPTALFDSKLTTFKLTPPMTGSPSTLTGPLYHSGLHSCL